MSHFSFSQDGKNHFDNKPYIEGEFLLQITHEGSVREILNNAPAEFDLKLVKLLSKPMRIWLFSFDYTAISHAEMQYWFYSQKHVAVADYNYHIQMRATTPGDPSFNTQWHHVNTGQTGGTNDADIDSDLAWDITTGGLTATNDDIVVCMVESSGGNLNHQDLSPNRWTNTGEIDGNGIDDDGNGYIDDYNGWNTGNDTDDTGTGTHGTNCLGMIGAKGDNGLNVVGANWDVKLMVVNMGGGLSQANVIEAYTYPLTLRQQWNNSGGTEGAFVVATSASWGIDGADPTDYPLWCSFYDTLGYYGIINVGATTNSNLDVDVAGDMPTACASEYMVGVGRTDDNDNTAGGYGDQTILLGAPGIDVVTTSGTTGITTTTGTSFACPLTAGVIGLAYSIPCPDFMGIVTSDPKGAADLVLQALIDGVDQKPQLSTRFITGGRLNAKNLLDELMAVVCSGSICLAPSAVSSTVVDDDEANINFTVYGSASSTNLYWREVGAGTWNLEAGVTSPFNLSGLIGCTEYEFYMESDCSGDISNPSATQSFTTTGCGNCVELAYCTNNATDGTDEWIESFTLDTYTNNSGNDGGYADFTMSGSIDLDIDATYNFTVDVEWGGTLYDEYTRIWVDLNQNGTFEAGEMLFDQGAASQTDVNGTITIPAGTPLGSTRMRVQMAYLGSGQATLPGVCGSFTWGEVEDYCLNLTSGTVCAMNVNSTVTDPTCEGQDDGSIAVAVSGGTPSYTYDWGAAGGDVDNISNLTEGAYTVTITDNAGCDTTINYNLAYVITLGGNFTNADASCNGFTDGESVVTGTGGTGYSYQWTSGPAGDTYSGIGAGNYSVTVTDIASGCETVESTTINEPPADQASFTSSATFLDVDFTNTSTPGTYEWDFGDGVGTSTIANPSYSYGSADTYTVCLEVTTACGVTQFCDDVTVEADVAALSTLSMEGVQVYPNPTSGIVNFKVVNANVKSIEILDIVGKVITKQQVVGELTMIDLNNLNDGTYFYRITDLNNSILAVDKLMIAR